MFLRKNFLGGGGGKQKVTYQIYLSVIFCLFFFCNLTLYRTKQ